MGVGGAGVSTGSDALVVAVARVAQAETIAVRVARARPLASYSQYHHEYYKSSERRGERRDVRV